MKGAILHNVVQSNQKQLSSLSKYPAFQEREVLRLQRCFLSTNGQVVHKITFVLIRLVGKISTIIKLHVQGLVVNMNSWMLLYYAYRALLILCSQNTFSKTSYGSQPVLYIALAQCSWWVAEGTCSSMSSNSKSVVLPPYLIPMMWIILPEYSRSRFKAMWEYHRFPEFWTIVDWILFNL